MESWLTVVVPLMGALLAGSLVGLERSFRGRAAGMRTYALVCLTSSMLMLLGRQALGAVPPSFQLSQVVQGIMTGVGFLGAGVIFREGFSVRGLTTAASIWTTAGLGVLIGLGLWAPALLGTLATLGVLSGFRYLERCLPQETYAQLLLRFARPGFPDEGHARALVIAQGFTVVEISYRVGGGGTHFEYRMTLFTLDRTSLGRLAAKLAASPAVLEFRLEPKVE